MRDAPEMHVTLAEENPGLRQCLLQFLHDYSGDQTLEPEDGSLRKHYLEIAGTWTQDRAQMSSVVHEHIQVFYNTIFWYLHAYYGKAMAKEVMVIVAYGEAVGAMTWLVKNASN